MASIMTVTGKSTRSTVQRKQIVRLIYSFFRDFGKEDCRSKHNFTLKLIKRPHLNIKYVINTYMPKKRYFILSSVVFEEKRHSIVAPWCCLRLRTTKTLLLAMTFLFVYIMSLSLPTLFLRTTSFRLSP